MVLPAAAAQSLTSISATRDASAEIQQEVSQAEIKVTQATGKGAYVISYNASIIGNPAIDPRVYTADLPPLQQQFYNAFVTSGYIVGLDILTGFWSIDWSLTGPEAQVLAYSVRTTFDPTVPLDGVARTISAMKVFFGGLVPVVHTVVNYNGDLDETDFSGVASTFYEFTVVAGQYADRTDRSATLLGFLETQGIGYTSSNTQVYLMTPYT